MFSLGKEPDFAAPGGLKPVGSSMMTRPPAEDLEFLGKTYAREGAAFLICGLLSAFFCLEVEPNSEGNKDLTNRADAFQEGDMVRLKEDGQKVGQIYQIMTSSNY